MLRTTGVKDSGEGLAEEGVVVENRNLFHKLDNQNTIPPPFMCISIASLEEKEGKIRFLSHIQGDTDRQTETDGQKVTDSLYKLAVPPIRTLSFSSKL